MGSSLTQITCQDQWLSLNKKLGKLGFSFEYKCNQFCKRIWKIHQIFDITNLKTKILAKVLLGCCKISSSSFLTDPTNQSGASGGNKVAWRCGISQMSLAESLGHSSNLNHLKRRFRLPLFRKTIQKVECLRFSVIECWQSINFWAHFELRSAFASFESQLIDASFSAHALLHGEHGCFKSHNP